jgi:hypothetical protein
MPVAETRLRDLPGLASISFVGGQRHLAVVDSTMSGVALAAAQQEWRPDPAAAGAQAKATDGAAGDVANAISIANFTFAPALLAARPGSASPSPTATARRTASPARTGPSPPPPFSTAARASRCA